MSKFENFSKIVKNFTDIILINFVYKDNKSRIILKKENYNWPT